MKKAQNTVRFVDIDETVFHTTAQVKIRSKEGNLIQSLTNQQWNAYPRDNLRAKTEFADFSEFVDADKFFRESTPIQPMIEKLQEWSRQMKVDPKHLKDLVVFVTARGDFDDREKFLDTFRQQLIHIDDKEHFYVSRTGNLTDDARVNQLPLSTAQRKKIIYLSRLIDKMPTHAELYEDDPQNIKDFMELENEMPVVKYRAFLVKDNKIKQVGGEKVE